MKSKCEDGFFSTKTKLNGNNLKRQVKKKKNSAKLTVSEAIVKIWGEIKS